MPPHPIHEHDKWVDDGGCPPPDDGGGDPGPGGYTHWVIAPDGEEIACRDVADLLRAIACYPGCRVAAWADRDKLGDHDDG